MARRERLEAPPGFGLEALEVLNWGTFDRRVWTMSPDCRTALLTGANGSGKSTLVDALLTLLVPGGKRSYNQASGADKKRERDERSYVLGAFGRKRDESEQERTQYLRDRKSFSVLLARFRSPMHDAWVTLAQVFWFDEQESLRKMFIAAERELAIEGHFTAFAHPRDLRARLRKLDGVEVFDAFQPYGTRFRKLLGLKSEKALELFHQTVAIKSIGNLNGFVRDHMLERFDARGRIDALVRNYENLTQSYEALRDAERQQAALAPLVREADQRDKLLAAVDEVQEYRRLVPAFFAREALRLLETEIGAKQEALSITRGERDSLTEQLQQQRGREVDLRAALQSDETGRRLRDLEREIEHLEQEIARKRGAAEQYARLAVNLGFPSEPDREGFHASLSRAREHRTLWEAERSAAEEKWAGAKAAKRRLQEEREALERDIESLKSRRSHIPRAHLELRAELAAELGAGEDELPFAGELLRVREGEEPWEGALERLLRPFALRLLVPESRYRAVTGYVNRRSLGLKLVYQKVELKRGYALVRDISPEAACRKVDVKEDSPQAPFADWLAQELSQHFDHVCCDDLDRFQREARALTAQGLLKGSRTLHEKDDRRDLWDRRQFLLGWDNRKKLEALEAALRDCVHRAAELDEEIREAEDSKRNLQERLNALVLFLSLEDFERIDFHRDVLAMQERLSEKTRLEESADGLRSLREALEAVLAELRRGQERLGGLERRLGGLEKELDDLHDLRPHYESELEGVPEADRDRVFPVLAPMAELKTLTLGHVEERKDRLLEVFEAEIEKKRSAITDLERALIRKMSAFLKDFQRYAESADADLAALGEFRRFLDRIEREDLPRHRQRFKELLNENVINDIVGFHQSLRRQEEEIRERIEALNQTLRGIDYSPTTYIVLQTRSNRDVDIQGFRSMLADCVPDLGRPDAADDKEASEQSFHKIRVIIDRFREDDRWTEKVTDVRNWIDFSASERYREDHKERASYSDSAGLSGGQKAKLAYTILASAIAYQYGLDGGVAGFSAMSRGLGKNGKDGGPGSAGAGNPVEQLGFDLGLPASQPPLSLPDTPAPPAGSLAALRASQRTFRFIAVDEAFSRSDEANSRYAMQLFRDLGLQVLVVTPLDKIHVVEPFMASCHFVWNSQELDSSKVLGMAMEEYVNRKEEFHAGVRED